MQREHADTPEILVAGLGLAILLPVVPFALEMLALRRLDAGAFGTLMALEPAFAVGVGLVVLGQVPGPLAALGSALVVTAGIGAARSGERASREPAAVVVAGPGARPHPPGRDLVPSPAN